VEIVDKEFFHVNREPGNAQYSLMKFEESFTVGEKFNPFFKYHSTMAPPNFKAPSTVNNGEREKKYDALDYFGGFRDKTLYTSDIDQLGHDAYESIMFYLMHWREGLWEYVRLCDFPDMPSRQKCMWLSHTLEEAEYWIERINGKDEEIPSQIVKVRVTGKIHVADAKLLMIEGENLEQAYSTAKKYWRGEKAEGRQEKEVLFEGTGTVIEIIQS